MTIEVAKYQFQSWVRKGISTQISEQDSLGNPATAPTGRTRIGPDRCVHQLHAAGRETVRAHRPGRHHRCPSRHGRAHRAPQRQRELRAELSCLHRVLRRGFSWRYTPAKPHGDKLRPWLLLLVLKEDEFIRDDRRVPLPVVTVKRKEALPRSDETWLFAHAHLEQAIPPNELSNLELYLKSLQAALTTDPDKLYSRLMSPRHLDPNTAYQAFLVPAFEVGRLPASASPTPACRRRSLLGMAPPASSCRSTTTGRSVPARKWTSNRSSRSSSHVCSTRHRHPEHGL